MTHKEQKTFLISMMRCKNSVVYVQKQMNIFLRNLTFVKTYIDDIVIRFKSMQKHLHHFRTIFQFFVKSKISIKFIKIFIVYFDVIFLNQKINVLNLSITKEKLKIIIDIQFLETFDDLKTYLNLTSYIKNHIYFFFSYSRFFAKSENSSIEKRIRRRSQKKTIYQ